MMNESQSLILKKKIKRSKILKVTFVLSSIKQTYVETTG